MNSAPKPLDDALASEEDRALVWLKAKAVEAEKGPVGNLDGRAILRAINGLEAKLAEAERERDLLRAGIAVVTENNRKYIDDADRALAEKAKLVEAVTTYLEAGTQDSLLDLQSALSAPAGAG